MATAGRFRENTGSFFATLTKENGNSLMNLHEYQSKEVFREFGIPVPKGRAARSPRKRSPLPRS